MIPGLMPIIRVYLIVKLSSLKGKKIGMELIEISDDRILMVDGTPEQTPEMGRRDANTNPHHTGLVDSTSREGVHPV